MIPKAFFKGTRPVPPTPRRGEGEGTREYIMRLRSLGIKAPSVKMIKTPEEIEGCRIFCGDSTQKGHEAGFALSRICHLKTQVDI